MAGPEEQVTLRDYLQVVWLRWWLVAIVTAACAITAYTLSALQTPVYESSALLMYQQPANIADPLRSDPSTDVNTLALRTQSVVNTINSPDVTERARETVQPSREGAAYQVTAEILPPDSTTGATVSDVVKVTAASSDPRLAAAAAGAYAQAVIATRVDAETARLRAAQDAVEAQMALFRTEGSKLSTDYLLLAQRLRDLQVAEATATGDFKIVKPPVVPVAPTSPQPLRAGLVGLAVGLFLGIAMAFVWAQFDTRVRTHRHVNEILDLPVMGRVPRVSKETLKSGGLLTLTEPHSGAAEAVRMLRSNLSWSSIDDRWKSLLITSSRKGEGKTLTICNLGVALALAGKGVVILDADLRAPRVHSVFQLPNRVGVSTVLSDAASLGDAMSRFDLNGFRKARVSLPGGEAVQEDTDVTGSLLILTSGPLPPNPGEVVASRRMADTIKQLTSSDADYVLVDAPPLLSTGDAAVLSHVVDGLLLVVNLAAATRPVLEDTREALDALSCRKLGLVIVGEQQELSAYYNYGRTK